jgi:protein-S-isoprenylcysteine O-methyltransferase Ste14
MTPLAGKAAIGLARLFAVMSALLFAVAGSLAYWQGWVFLAVFFTANTAIFLYLLRNDPALLERRMKRAEGEKRQRVIRMFLAIAFLAVFVGPALDDRFGWSSVPVAVVLAGDVLVALGLAGIFFVFRENSFTSAVIEVGAEQKVIASGPYALVRHPMYSAALVMALGMPLSLGSWWGLIVVVPIALVLIWRLLDEEKFLVKNLPGYGDYLTKVRYRLVPGLW